MVTDPFAPLRGISRSDKEENHLQPFRGRTDIIIKTMAPLSNSQRQSAEAFEISYPGEYEIKNVSIRGWAITASSIKYQVSSLRSVYLLEIDDLKIVLLGHLVDENKIKNVQEYLEDADIVFAPAGGEPLIKAEAMAKLIRQLKPSLVIPTLFNNLEDLKPFLKELGKNNAEPQEKLTISKKGLSKEKMLIGCLKI